MAQRTGALVFDERTDRYDIRFDLNTYYGGLHCGECFDVFVRGKWKPIQPAVLAAQAHAVKEQAVEHLGFCGNVSEPFLREQHLGDAVKEELFRFRAVEIVIHGFCHAPLEALRRA